MFPVRFPRLNTTYFIGGALIALVGVLAWMAMQPTTPPFRKLLMASRLTQKRAIDLSFSQMKGIEPLQEPELEIGDKHGRVFEPPNLRDIIESMKEDYRKHKYDGICAMNYNVPVSVCYLPVLGSERDLVLFNLKICGYSQNTTVAGERSILCDEGKTLFGCDRFNFVWVEFWDGNLEYQYLKVPGRMGRVMQNLAWLNRGVTICDPLSSQEQANILFDAIRHFGPVN